MPQRSSAASDEGLSRIKAGAGHPSFNGQLSQWLLAAAGNEVLRDIWDKTMQQTLIYVNASLMRGQGTKSRVLIHKLIDRICAVTSRARRARELTRQTLVDLGIEARSEDNRMTVPDSDPVDWSRSWRSWKPNTGMTSTIISRTATRALSRRRPVRDRQDRDERAGRHREFYRWRESRGERTARHVVEFPRACLTTGAGTRRSSASSCCSPPTARRSWNRDRPS